MADRRRGGVAPHLARRPATRRRPAAGRRARRPIDLEPQLAERGVIFSDLATAVREHGDLVRRAPRQAGHAPGADADFWGRSPGRLDRGHVPLRPRGRCRRRDAHRAHHARAADGDLPPASRLVVVEEGARRTLLEEIFSPDGAARSGSAAPPTCRPATARRFATPTCSASATGPGTSARSGSRSGQDADVTTLNAEIGSAIRRSGGRAHDRQGRHEPAAGPARGRRGAAASTSTAVQDLIGSHTTADLLYLSALYDASHASFYGVTRVRPEAKQTS